MEPKCYICSVSRLSGILTNCPHATYPPPTALATNLYKDGVLRVEELPCPGRTRTG